MSHLTPDQSLRDLYSPNRNLGRATRGQLAQQIRRSTAIMNALLREWRKELRTP